MAYAWQAVVTIPAAVTANQTNISVVFKGTDTKFKTIANGGTLNNSLITRNGQSIPADFVISTDPNLGSLINWGWDYYNAATGDVVIWAILGSLTTGASIPIYGTFSDSGVTTWQGGAVGSEYDSTVGVWQFPNGSVLNVTDFSANNITTTNHGASAVSGKIDGGIALVRASSQYVSAASNTGFNSGNFTAGAWFNTSNSAQQDILRRDDASNRSFLLRVSAGQVMGILIYGTIPSVASIASTYADGNWHYAVMTASLAAGTTTLALYVDGVIQGTASTVGSNPSISIPLDIGRYSAANEYFDGSIDSVRFQFVARLADWVGNEYANQNNPPVFGVPYSFGSTTLRLLASCGVGA